MNLKEEALKFGIELDDEMINQFDEYANLLVEYNKVMNLTAITEKNEIDEKHFLDSTTLLLSNKLKENAKMIDIGAGAGFPSLPVKIARKDIDVVMLDSLNKRIGFLNTVIGKLGLEKIKAVHLRAEEGGRIKEYRENFDFVCSRAVAALNVLCEYCLPFVKVGGYFIAMKGAKAQEEIADAKSAIKLLGGKIVNEKSFSLSDGGERTLVVIKKISQIPPKYPRPSAQIAKKPL